MARGRALPGNGFKLSWDPAVGASAYRLTILDSSKQRVLDRSGELPLPEYELPELDSDVGSVLIANLEKRLHDTDEWQIAGPLAEVRLSGEVEISWDGREPIHRLVLLDGTRAQTLVDVVVLGSSTRLDADAIDFAHELRYYVQAWADGAWTTIEPWRPLARELSLGPPREPPPPLEPGVPPKLLVLFTVDTECSVYRQRHPNPARAVQELVFGEFGNGERLGVELQMDLLEHFGHRGCFFVDILMEHQFGQGALEQTVETILSRGHEIELHVHPENLWVARDSRVRELGGTLASYDLDRFRRLMELSVELFTQRVGRAPLAYRAGGYYIDEPMMRVLPEFGLAIDSSAHPYFHSRIPDWMRTRTRPFWFDGILEVPPSWFLRLDTDPPSTRVYAPNPMAGDPFHDVAPGLASRAPMVGMYVSHSFQMIQFSDETREFNADWRQQLREHLPADVAERLTPWDGYRFNVNDAAPDEWMIATVVSMLRRVAEAPDARCVTFSELQPMAGSWFGGPRDQPVDRVPAFDASDGVSSVWSTRVYTRGLLGALPLRGAGASESTTESGASLYEVGLSWRGADVAIVGDADAGYGWLSQHTPFRIERLGGIDELSPGDRDIVVWAEAVERRSPARLLADLAKVAAAVRPGGQLVLHVQTLGVSGDPALPALAELLFAVRDLDSWTAAVPAEVTAWDGASFRRVLAASGFEVSVEHRHERDQTELAAIDEHRAKLRGLDPAELRTGALTLVAKRGFTKARIPTAKATVADGAALLDASDLFGLQSAADRIYAGLAPGAELEVRLRQGPDALLTPTAMVLALKRAGLELLDAGSDSAPLSLWCSRPLDVDEILAYSDYQPPKA